MGVRNCKDIGENLQIIAKRLLANEELVKLLYYTDKDPLSQPNLTPEQKEKETLLSSKADFSLLEKLIKKSNENPNLKIEIFLNDGTRILMKTYEEHKPSASAISSSIKK